MQLSLKEIEKPSIEFWKAFNVLSEESCTHSVNMNSVWLANYIDCYLQENQSPYILAVFNENELVGCLPLQMSKIKGTKFYNITELRSLGFGPTDFFDIPLKKGFEEDAMSLMVKFIKKNKSWDKFALTDIPKNSNGLQLLKKHLKISSLDFREDHPNGFMYINTKDRDSDKFLKEKFYPDNKDLAKSERRIERQEYKLRYTSYKKNVYNELLKNIEMYAQRRESLGQFNNYETDKLKQFLKNIIEQYEALGKVELTILEANDEVWAFQLDWLSNNTRYHWNHAYNEEYKRYSPGKVILKQLLVDSMEDPTMHGCNHMRGLSNYKEKFTEEKEFMSRIRLENPASYKLKLTKAISAFLKLIGKK